MLSYHCSFKELKENDRSKMAVFWVVAPCSLVEVYRRFRRACCRHHQGDDGSDEFMWAYREFVTIRVARISEVAFIFLAQFTSMLCCKNLKLNSTRHGAESF
jgi:hypothetical protein